MAKPLSTDTYKDNNVSIVLYGSDDSGFTIERPHTNWNFNSRPTGSDILLFFLQCKLTSRYI